MLTTQYPVSIGMLTYGAFMSNIGWNLTPAQIAKLDAASSTTLAYPYWHQRGFKERNPAPV